MFPNFGVGVGGLSLGDFSHIILFFSLRVSLIASQLVMMIVTMIVMRKIIIATRYDLNYNDQPVGQLRPQLLKVETGRPA